MANIQLHQALTTQEQAAIAKVDLDNLVRWLPVLTLETEDDILSFIFDFKMPGLFPNGEWGFVVHGDSGLHAIPEPDKLDHRTSFRYGEIQRYVVKLKSLWGVVAPMTIYEGELRRNLANPKEWEAYFLAAVKKALPNYWKYLSYSIFKGKHKNTKKNLNDYINKFIEPSDGAQNGYKFYLDNGYGDINLAKVIAKSKVKEHALKKELERINKIIYKDANKVEAKLSDYIKKKPFIEKNFTQETQKSLAVYLEVRKQLWKILQEGRFDIKYKVDNTKMEGYNPPVTKEDIIVVLNRSEWKEALSDFNFYEEGFASLNLDYFEGVQVAFNDDMDRNTAIIMHKDLIKAFIIPEETRFINVPYEYEETRDIFYMARHTLDVIPIYSSLWVEFKSE